MQINEFSQYQIILLWMARRQTREVLSMISNHMCSIRIPITECNFTDPQNNVLKVSRESTSLRKWTTEISGL